MQVITFFNNKGGVGKTSLVYHVAWMCSEIGKRVLTVDFDPQSNLTAMFLEDEILEEIWGESGAHESILSCINPIMEGVGDIATIEPRKITENLYMIPGDLGLSRFEDKLSDSWFRCLSGDKASYRAITALYRIVYDAAEKVNADVVLIDVGPNLGAINRAALISSSHVIIPLAPGLFSLQGLRNVGPILRAWGKEWEQRLVSKPEGLDIPMPNGVIDPTGYVVMQHVERKRRPVKAYQRWVSKIPGEYQQYVLNQQVVHDRSTEMDGNCLGYIKNYQSLMPLAEDARKPIFKLTAADGAIGAHSAAVSKCYQDFNKLTDKILSRVREITSF